MIYFKIKTLLLTTILGFSGAVLAGQTPIFNTDLTGGSGDYENNERYLNVKCRITKGPHKGTYNPGDQLPPGYYCEKARGAYCENKKTQPLNSCKNMKVKWKWKKNQWNTGSNWPAGSTPWFDRDRPSGDGDYEIIEFQLKPTCYINNSPVNPSSLPAGYTCDKKRGAWCENAKTQPINTCKNVTIKYSW